jgi:hypothetical protein
LIRNLYPQADNFLALYTSNFSLSKLNIKALGFNTTPESWPVIGINNG